MMKSLIALSVAIALTACGDSTTRSSSTENKNKTAAEQAISARDLIQQHTVDFMYHQPALSTMMDVPITDAGGEYNHRWPDYSPEGMKKVQSLMKNGRLALDAYQNSSLSEKDQMHLDVVKVIEEYFLGFEGFSGGYIDTWGGHLPYIINQISGPLIDAPKLLQVQHPVKNKQQAEQYLVRLKGLKEFVENVVAKFNADAANGIHLPKKLYPNTLKFFDNFLAASPENHPLVTTYAEKLKAVTELNDEERDSFVAKAESIVESVVYPSYKMAFKTVSDSQVNALEHDGIWAQPNGAAFYQHEIKYLGDSDLSAEQIHETGLSEVARITQEMDKILSENGYKDETVGERMIALAKEERFLYEDSDKGRQQLLQDLNTQIEEIMALAPNLYATLPTQAVEVRRISPLTEDGEPGGFYSPPSLDGSRPGIYWINLRDMGAVPSFGLKTLTYHEAVPGHHFQIALNMAQQDIGLLRQNAPFNAYAEGWALYSELVAKEMGMYKNDPWGDLGRLQAELYRAVRLVVDTGLHYKKWTREQAIEYFHKTSGTSLTDVTAEVERYMAWPGQALGYKLGMIKMVELRDWAKQTLGDKFDYKAFHDVVLLPGARPMSVVKKNVEQWADSVK